MGLLEIVITIGALLLVVFIVFAIIRKIITIAISLAVVLVLVFVALYVTGVFILPFAPRVKCGEDVRVCNNGIVVGYGENNICYSRLGIKKGMCNLEGCEAAVNICK